MAYLLLFEADSRLFEVEDKIDRIVGSAGYVAASNRRGKPGWDYSNISNSRYLYVVPKGVPEYVAGDEEDVDNRMVIRLSDHRRYYHSDVPAFDLFFTDTGDGIEIDDQGPGVSGLTALKAWLLRNKASRLAAVG